MVNFLRDKAKAAETIFNFSLSLLALALVNKSLDISGHVPSWEKHITGSWYYGAFIGVFLLVVSGYACLSPEHRAQRWLTRVVNQYLNQPFKYLGWSMILILLGESLIKLIIADWAAIVGYISIGAGIGFFVTAFLIPFRKKPEPK